jgi:hypothetical protein
MQVEVRSCGLKGPSVIPSTNAKRLRVALAALIRCRQPTILLLC